jgi:hypothetical protein
MHVPRTDLTRRASDHAPLIVDVQLMAGHDDKLNPAGV